MTHLLFEPSGILRQAVKASLTDGILTIAREVEAFHEQGIELVSLYLMVGLCCTEYLKRSMESSLKSETHDYAKFLTNKHRFASVV